MLGLGLDRIRVGPQATPFLALRRVAPIVHTYRSGETGLFVNSYLVEGADGVVAIDAPLLLSDGRAFRARLEALGKPLLGVLVTHPHPDHYNTITELLAGEDVPVIAHRDVDREIRAKDDAKRAQWGPMFGDEWPASATFPNRTVADEESVELGDLRFTAWDFGPCESESETVWLLGDGDTAFVGDLAFNGTHAYLADGHTDAWLRAHRPGGGSARRRAHALRRPRTPPPCPPSSPSSAATC